MNKKVSIIVPVYNEEKYLNKCLNSLLDQSYEKTEIIVVDDGSTDHSKKIIEKFPVTYLYQYHQGTAAAKNLGSKRAMGEILVFADSDIYYNKDYVKDLVEPIIQNRAVGTYSKEMYVANPKNIWSQCYNINLNLDLYRKVPTDFPDEFIGYKAILKKVFLEVGGFKNLGYGEDLSLYAKIGIKSKAAKGAISYHYNPDSLKEVFTTARWIGKGNSFNFFLTVARLIKYSLPFTLLAGIFKSIKYKKIQFIIFKIIWDFGISIGIIDFFFRRKHAK